MKKINNSEINKARLAINDIDEKLISLLNQRLKYAKQIGTVKQKLGLPVFDPMRESEVYKKVKKLNSGFPDELLECVYSNIMAASRLVERRLKIIYLGPAGSFTHIAARNNFKECDFIEANSISAVFTDVEKSIGDYGIVPIENSNNGVVTYTLDKLLTTSLNIVSEALLKVSHNLVSSEKNIDKVKKIYSHPQVFGQCENWIASNLKKNIQLIPVESTSLAAEIAAENKGVAAIGSALAADIYGLNILSSNIEDFKNNMTRFLIIGRNFNNTSGKDKTSIAFAAKDRVGVLYKCLEPFAKNRINLSKIESRPAKNAAWNYVFFADFSGHIDDLKVKKTLAELDKYCLFIKILGSYPVAV